MCSVCVCVRLRGNLDVLVALRLLIICLAFSLALWIARVVACPALTMPPGPSPNIRESKNVTKDLRLGECVARVGEWVDIGLGQVCAARSMAVSSPGRAWPVQAALTTRFAPPRPTADSNAPCITPPGLSVVGLGRAAGGVG